ncbi:MAG: Stealth CR1 domain-containing protein [Gammaproteobacteria bacterium]|nr:Stealth CR1 domain-containing protein [Gammaproteobacteria bacterium]
MVIDAVVTWVDGADEAHLKKRLNYLKSIQNNTFDVEAALPTRFDSSGEIDFCLRSLLKFAPWLRTIYIVTDGQIPPILKTWQGTSYASRFKVVDHRDIFQGFQQYLPTFNSLTIESMLWRIPGLSEQFIYLNDDCILLRPLKTTDFFQDEKPVLRGRWKTQAAHKWDAKCKRLLGLTIPVIGHRLFQETSAHMAGFHKKFMYLPHVPFPLLKQTFVDFFNTKPEVLLKNIQYRLRHPEQFWSISLAYHLEIKQQQVVFDNRLREVSINPAHHTWHKIEAKLTRAAKDLNTVFACIQSLDQATPEVREQLIHWLNTQISSNC